MKPTRYLITADQVETEKEEEIDAVANLGAVSSEIPLLDVEATLR